MGGGYKIAFNIGGYQSNFSFWSGGVHVSARGVRGYPVYIVAISEDDGERSRYWISTCSYRDTAEEKIEEIRKYLKGKTDETNTEIE